MPSNTNNDIVQLNHSDSKFKNKKNTIVLICDHLDKAANVGGIFRLADGFGVQKVYFIGGNTPLSHKTKKASRSTFKYVDYDIIENPDNTISHLRAHGYTIFSLEIANNSKNISTLIDKPTDKVAWIIGNESQGISKTLLECSDEIYHIDMDGNNTSFNVVTAASIALYSTRVDLNSNP